MGLQQTNWWRIESTRATSEISDALRDRVEQMVRALRPQAAKFSRTQNEVRFGSKGSLAVTIGGPDIGRITDFEAEGKGRGPIDFICDELGCSRRNAILWARDWLGQPETPHVARPKKRAPSTPEKSAETKSSLARSQWANAEPITGTPAEKYLQSRGISRWPEDSVRYCRWFESYLGDQSPKRAVLFPVSDKSGQIVAVQAVFLTAVGEKTLECRAKTSLGPIGQGFVRFNGSDEICIAEGPETALSVWLATGFTVVACLGPITATRVRSLGPRAGNRIMIAADAADIDSPAAKAVNGAIKTALEMGAAVRVAAAPGSSGTDWNDVLRRDGQEAVQSAILAHNWIYPRGYGPAKYPAPVLLAEDARRSLTSAICNWGDATLDFSTAACGEGPEPKLPPIHVVKATTGLGKSHAAGIESVKLVQRFRAAGLKGPVVVLVPTHSLAEETAQNLRGLAPGLDIAIYRGRGRDDPDIPGQSMCRRADEASRVSEAGLSVSRVLCKPSVAGGSNNKCPFYQSCAYRKQSKRKADIWIAPHALLWFHPMTVMRPLALVIDENPISPCWIGFDRPEVLEKNNIAGIVSELGTRDPQAAKILEKFTAIVFQQSRGQLNVGHLKKNGVTADGLHRTLGMLKKIDDCGEPLAQPFSSRLDTSLDRIARWNQSVTRLQVLLRSSVRALNKGFDSVPAVELMLPADGKATPMVQVFWCKPLPKEWQVPTLILDATAEPDLLREIWPRLDVVQDILAAARNMHVRQILDRSFSRTSLDAPNAKSENQRIYAKNLLAKLLRFIEVEAYKYEGQRRCYRNEAVEQ